MLSSAVLGLLHYDHVCCNLCHTQLHKCSNSLKPFTDLKSSNHPLILRSDREGNMLIFNSSSRSHSSNSPPLLFHYSFPLQLHTSSRISSHHIASHHITSHHITSHHITSNITEEALSLSTKSLGHRHNQSAGTSLATTTDHFESVNLSPTLQNKVCV